MTRISDKWKVQYMYDLHRFSCTQYCKVQLQSAL